MPKKRSDEASGVIERAQRALMVQFQAVHTAPRNAGDDVAEAQEAHKLDDWEQATTGKMRRDISLKPDTGVLEQALLRRMKRR